MQPRAFDLFCRVVDHYGDAGVCWRLSRQLAAMGHTVRLWIDDLQTLSALAPGAPTPGAVVPSGRLQVLPWAAAETADPPRPGIVIEAFACDLPESYRRKLDPRQQLWINLEYLSAEPWVDDCHGLPSLQPDGARKYFYFPGFTEKTGGLLREPGLVARQRAAHRRTDRAARLRALLGGPADMPDDAFSVLLFCYPNAPVEGLLQGLSRLRRAVYIHVPDGIHVAEPRFPNVHIRPFRFLPQVHFDDLLGCCDLLFVRGEDSLVRALWSARPFIWQAYPQRDSAHLEKVAALLERAALPAPVATLMRAWNQSDAEASAHALPACLAPEPLKAWQSRMQHWADVLSDQTDLARRLCEFCAQHQRAN